MLTPVQFFRFFCGFKKNAGTYYELSHSYQWGKMILMFFFGGGGVVKERGTAALEKNSVCLKEKENTLPILGSEFAAPSGGLCL